MADMRPTSGSFCGSFARGLRAMRGRRRRYRGPQAADIMSLVTFFEASGYPLTRSRYRTIEHGLALPENTRFIALIALYMQLSQQEETQLLHQFAHDLLCERLGHEMASIAVDAD